MRKILVISTIALSSLLVLGACSDSTHDPMPGMQSNSATPSGQQAGHNAEDVSFAQQMIPHHSQALEMAKLVPSRSTDRKVLDLAARIEKGQDPEIRQMQAWLTTWGAGAASASSMPGMTQESMPMPGVMSDADMKTLGQLKGAEFDKMWLDLMTKHHQGAIDMAKTELGNGSNPDAKALAQKIIDAQQGEIAEMRGLLQQN